MNRIVLTGRIVRTPDYSVRDGKQNARFSIAVDRAQKNANGEFETAFINVVSFGKQAELVNQYCKKGMLVGVDGKLQLRKYVNKAQVEVVTFDVIADSVQFLEAKKDSESVDANEIADAPVKSEDLLEDEPEEDNSKNIDNDMVANDDLPF